MVHEKRLQGKPQAAAEASSASQPAKREKKPSRPSGSLSQLILQAFETALPRKGLSLVALKRFLAEAGYNVSKNNGRLKREIRTLVTNGLLVRITGNGVSGTFKPGRRRRCRRPGKTRLGNNKPEKRPAKKPLAGPGAAKTVPAKSGEPKKRPRKKQPAVNKPKGLPSRAGRAPADRKRQLRKC